MLSDFNDLPRDKHVLSLDWHMVYNEIVGQGVLHCLAINLCISYRLHHM